MKFEYVVVIQIIFIICNKIQLGFSQCPTGWIALAPPLAPICMCLKLVPTVPAGTTYMSSPRQCLLTDPRSSMIFYDGTAQQASITAMAGPMASMYAVSNVPVGLYSDNSNNIRHITDQQITLPIATTVPGKCQFLLATGNLATNYSCLQQPTSVICLMDCLNATMPPPPAVTNGTDRCGESNFNMTCPSDWINLGGLCYKNPVDSNTLLNNNDAASACAAAGGWLPSFANLKEWQAVMNYVYYTGISGPDSWAAPLWLGGTLAGQTGTWDDGTPWSFQYWAPYMPVGQSECFWWSVGQGDYWSEGNCTVPGVAFCQFYTCPTTTEATTSTSTTTTTSTTSTTSTSTSTPTTTTTTATTTTPTTTATTTTPKATTTPSTNSAASTSTSPAVSASTSSVVTISTTPTTSTSTTQGTTTTLPKTTIIATTPVTNTPSMSTSTIAATTKPTTTTPAATTPTTTTTAIPTSTGTCTITPKDESACMLPYSFWLTGICYTFYTNTMNYNQAATQCANVGAQLAVVRSLQVAELLGQIYVTAKPSATNIRAWLGSPDEGKPAYNQVAGMDPSGNVTIVVNVTNGQCLALSANIVTGNTLFITDNNVCMDVNPFFCETRSTFLQKGCNQSLNSVAVTSEVVTTLELCTQNCAQTTTCTGVNYNSQNQLCKSLDENTCKRSLICEPNWNYFERV